MLKNLICLVLCLMMSDSSLSQNNSAGLFDGRLGAVTIALREADGRIRPERLALIDQSADERLIITFDVFGLSALDLVYSLEHCDAEGHSSGLLPGEAIEGLREQELAPPIVLHASPLPYQHYTLELPNDQLSFLISGRYRLSVYSRWAVDKPLLELPVFFSDGVIAVEGDLLSMFEATANQEKQQLRLQLSELDHIRTGVNDQVQVKVVVLQDASLTIPSVMLSTPTRQEGDRYVYDWNKAPTFWAGNEYLHLEHSSNEGRSFGVYNSTVQNGCTYLQVTPYAPGVIPQYHSISDQDGRQLIRSSSRVHAEGEYHLVEFSLVMPERSPGRVILEGEAFDHIPIEKRSMTYDNTRACYRLTLPLKAGYQDYRYVFLPEVPADYAHIKPLDGSYYETGHSYTVLVYCRKFGERSEQLVGHGTIYTPSSNSRWR